MQMIKLAKYNLNELLEEIAIEMSSSTGSEGRLLSQDEIGDKFKRKKIIKKAVADDRTITSQTV